MQKRVRRESVKVHSECGKLEVPLRFQLGDIKDRDEVRFIKYT